jgi:mannose-6-phosphate isomerase-like protein (cupin superfamily)
LWLRTAGDGKIAEPMAIITNVDYAPFDVSDPDDFRPDSKWALLIDPVVDAGTHVDNITLIFEEIAPGDRIPLHTHPIHEVLVFDEGTAEVTLGNETREVGPGAVVSSPPERHTGRKTRVPTRCVFTRCFRLSGSAFGTSSATPCRGPRAIRRSRPSRSTFGR